MTAGRPSARRSLAVATFASVLVGILGGAGGCELAIGDTVPTFYCNGGPNTCPQGQVCDMGTHDCVPDCRLSQCAPGRVCDPLSHICTSPSADGGMLPDVVVDEASGQDVADVVDSMSSDEDAIPPTETGPEAPGNCPGGILCACSGDTACTSKLCVDSLAVGSGLYQAAGSSNFCTQPCCTSADCPTSPVATVCYATGQGGNYCVDPAWIGRTSGLGTGTGGATCSLGRDCRSGLCTGNSCVDTCCSTAASSTECAGADVCTFGNFPGANSIDKNFSAYCGQGGTGTGGSTCFMSSDCQSYLCAATGGGMSNHCLDACRSGSDCTGGYYCNYVLPPNQTGTPMPTVGACLTTQGSLDLGQSCNPSNDMCKGFCDPSSMMCTDVCFGDMDCSGVTGWRCRDETIAVQGGGSYSVLCCGT
jgi:hypothetical protein